MQERKLVRAFAAVTALFALGAVPANTGSRGGPPAEPGYRQAIDISTTRPATPGCTYRSRIHGTVVALDAAPSGPAVGALYLPDDLIVDAVLDCGSAQPPRRVSQALTLDAPLSRERFASAIERVSQLQVPTGRLVCTVAPRVALTNGVPVTTDVSSRCEPTRVDSGIR